MAVRRKILGRLAEVGIISATDAVRLTDYDASKPLKRAFAGAQVTNITAGMVSTPKPIDTDIRSGLRRLKARAREEAQNNDHVRRFLSLVKTNVIGHHGIKLRARFIDPSGTEDRVANEAVEAFWADWGKKGNCDVTGKLSWRMVQRLYVENLARDGEVLIRRVRGWGNNAYGYALQFLDTELLDVEYNGDYRGNRIRMGVELDAWRRPVAYHLVATEQTADDYLHMGRRYIRIPADEIIHDFLPEWVWQTRGFPWMSSALLRLNMLNGYEESELIASRVAASKMGFFQRTEEAPLDPTSDTPVMGSGEKDAKGNFVQDAEPGTFEVLPDGYTLSNFDPQHPNAAYADFVKAMLRGIAGGLGVPYNALANDLEGVNLSTMRHAEIDARSVWMALQDFVIESFCDVVYNDWLVSSLPRGVLTVAGRPLRTQRLAKYQRVAWKPRRWQMVDPNKEMQANETAFTHKIRSPQQVIIEQGGDPQEVLDEWRQWYDMLAERGLPEPPDMISKANKEPATSAGSSVMGDENADQDNQD